MTAKKSAPELPKSRKGSLAALPKITKFADTDTKLPSGKSTIEIIKAAPEPDLKTAASEANKELSSLLGAEPNDKPVIIATPTITMSDDAANQQTADQPIADDILDSVNPEVLDPAIDSPVTEATDEDAQPEPHNENTDGLPDDAFTQAAVDEIVAEESDALLAAEDKERATEIEGGITNQSSYQPVRLWQKASFRWGFAIILLATLLLVGLTPSSRYYVLNLARVRSSLSVRIIDNTTLQPLKNVAVQAGSADALTDRNGEAVLTGVRLGQTNLIIEKKAFATIEQPIVVGWGSNPLGEFRATAVGEQYTIFVTDFLSNQAVARAEASAGEGSAVADEAGKIVLTLDTKPEDQLAEIAVTITAPDYRDEVVMIARNNDEDQITKLVPAKKHVFVSKRSGTYDVYSIDLDGKNEKKLVTGTGLERDDLSLIPHPKDNKAVLISTRIRETNTAGYLLSTMYIIDTTDGHLTRIDQSEKIHSVGWANNERLVYVKIAAGASAIDPSRHRLMSLNLNDFNDKKELHSSNAFNDVVMIGSEVIFAPSNVFQENSTPATYRIAADGSGKKIILDQESFVLQRTDIKTLALSAGDRWYQYSAGSTTEAQATAAPTSQINRFYVQSPNGSSAIWIDQRDGRGTILLSEQQVIEEKVLISQAGLKYPVYWLDEEVVIFRVQTGRETADYAMHKTANETYKITDVTNASGIDRWLYY
jgi:hypothetical protein